MFKSVILAFLVWFGASIWTVAAASNFLELGGKPKDNSIEAIGKAPPKKITPLNLGGLRTKEAALPPLPLTRQERMALRARHAVQRQKEVTSAKRTPRSESRGPRVKRKKKPQVETEQEVVLFDDNNQPALQ